MHAAHPSFCRVAIAASLLAAAATTAPAALYSSQPSFLAAIQSPSLTENFSSATSPGGPTLTRSASGYSVQFSTTAQALLVFDLAGDNYLTISTATDGFSRPITLTFTSNNVTAVGGSFFQTSGFGVFLSSPVTLNFSDGTTQVLTPASNTDFFGYTSLTPIASLTVSPDASNHFVSIDNIRIGAALIPTPAAATLLGLGLFGIGRRRRFLVGLPFDSPRSGRQQVAWRAGA